MEVVGIIYSVEHDQLESTVCRILYHIGVNTSGNNTAACYRLDKNGTRLVKFSSKKNYEHTMDVKKYLKGLMLLTWTFQQGETSILMIVCVSMK